LATPAHPLTLMLAAFLTHAPGDVRGISPVFKIVSAGSHESAIECCRPLVIGPSEAPYLIGRQAEITEYLPERLAGIDRIQKLLPHRDG